MNNVTAFGVSPALTKDSLYLVFFLRFFSCTLYIINVIIPLYSRSVLVCMLLTHGICANLMWPNINLLAISQKYYDIWYTRNQMYEHVFKSKPNIKYNLRLHLKCIKGHAFLHATSDQVIDEQIKKYLISKIITRFSEKYSVNQF